MRPRWRKVLHDLWDSKARTLLVVLSIAVGVFSIGVIAGTYEIISNDIGISYAANNPSNIELRTSNFDEDILSSLQNAHNVNEVEARRVINFRVRREDSDQWITIDLVAFESFSQNKVNLLVPVEGQVEAHKDEIIIDKTVLDDMDIAVGQYLVFELPDGSTKSLRVVGIVKDSSTGAGDFLASPFAFTLMDTMQTLQQPELFNRAFITVTGDQNDSQYIRDVGSELKDKLEKSDVTVIRSVFSETNKHPLADVINAVLGILMALGILIVLLSSSLIANTLSALLNQHYRHIGVIKLIGGRNHQVLRMYLTLIFAFSILALLIAVPTGGQGAYALASYMADMLNFGLLGYRIVPLAFLIQILVGILVPLIAGLAPVLKGSKITVLRALSNDLAGDESKPQAGTETRVSWLDWALVRFTRILSNRGIQIPRPFIISLRNTFRRRSRLLLTLFTLTMGGAIFIAVFNVRVSLNSFVDDLGSYFRADVTLDFDQAYRINKVKQYAMQVDGVKHVEGWQFIAAELLYPNGTIADNINLLAPPAETELVNPILASGRWLKKDDVRKLVISESVVNFIPNLQVGDLLRLKVNGQDEYWEVVGIFKFIGHEGILAYTPLEYAQQASNLMNRAYSFRVVTTQHDRAFQDAVAEKLDDFFRANGFKVREAESGLASLDTITESMNILITFLLIMAVLTAVVGAMGLTGTMGMNVLERTREIGIMRAIGADDAAIMRTVISEGFVIGIISFILAIFLSIPITYGLSYILAITVFESPITVVFTYLGYAIWLGLIILLSVLGSVLPARNAARLTIREVLAYE
ncbi:MAG: ABC transporter permease [Chloroflexi bacterium OLB14]|nr:MAG: ABC transporter permease [Chloroflexi bacterium OLB14]